MKLRTRRTIIPFGVFVFMISGIVASCSNTETSSVVTTGTVLRVVVPAGTFDAVARGEFVDLLPEIVQVKVGDEFVVVNNDTFTHVIGPFSVRPGETLHHYWSQVTTIEGDCTILLNDRVLIIVTS
jgi:hypothetical protein